MSRVSPSNTPMTIRAAGSSPTVITLLLSSILAIGAWAILNARTVQEGLEMALFVGFGGAVVAFFESFKIVLFEDRIEYSRFPAKNWSVPFDDIRGVEMRIGRITGGKEGFYSLALLRRSSNKPELINIKPFSRKDLAMVVQTINAKAPNVEMDTYAQHLKNADVRPIIAQGIRRIWQPLLYLFLSLLATALVRAWLRH